ncbi:hypothetical protein BCV70DRAFT_217954 [Testicularia cyperi]|uniref:Uncharacterized protein n=1 Tax=Testicularia cyperi TaxID=1882483 RepID=A0A317XLN6_9BASI|nr:hypothetical protein BCV70DRAFT_217954 [Testicularia cyperi]
MSSTIPATGPTGQRILSNREADTLMKQQKAKALKECKAQMEGPRSRRFPTVFAFSKSTPSFTSNTDLKVPEKTAMLTSPYLAPRIPLLANVTRSTSEETLEREKQLFLQNARASSTDAHSV